MPELLLKGVEHDEEMRLACELMARSHAPDPLAGRRWLAMMGSGYSGHYREHVRIAMSGGEVVSALRCTLETIRIGEARLRMGGLGWISVSARPRGPKGLRALIANALHYLATQRCHVSMLFAAPGFCDGMGFTHSLTDYAFVAPVCGNCFPDAPPCRMRFGKPGDIRSLQRLHEAADSDTVCSVVRSGAHITNQWERWRRVRVLTDDQGKVCAYFVCRPATDALLVEEAAVCDPEYYGAIVAACMRLGASEGRVHLRFCTPP